MFKYIYDFIKNYNPKLLAADFLFASDIMANGIWGNDYYQVFTGLGIPGNIVNSVVSILELVRIVLLIQSRHQNTKIDS